VNHKKSILAKFKIRPNLQKRLGFQSNLSKNKREIYSYVFQTFGKTCVLLIVRSERFCTF